MAQTPTARHRPGTCRYGYRGCPDCTGLSWAQINEQTRIADEASERRLHDEARDDHEHDWRTR